MPHAIAPEIDQQVAFLHRCRSVFPRLDADLVGKSSFEAPEYFKKQGHSVTVSLSEPMTTEFIHDLNELAHWLNENYVMRIYALLESHKLVGGSVSIRKDLDGWNEVDMVRRLRGKSATDRRATTRMTERKLRCTAGSSNTSSCPIDTRILTTTSIRSVLHVFSCLAEGCKKCAEAVLNARPSARIEGQT
jgi:hypothetical protein